MLFSGKLCVIGLAITVAHVVAVPFDDISLNKRDSNCETGPGWAPVLIIGSNDKTGMQCETQYGHDYTPITTIEVWRRGDKDGSRIAGIQFTYGSGVTSPVYGQEDTAEYPSSTLKLSPGETITSAILYGNGKGTWLGHIHLETSAGQTFDAGRDTSGIHPYGVTVGSGLLLGAWVTALPTDEGEGSNIGSLGFLFLGQPIDHISISDINFTNDPSGSSEGIEPQSVSVGHWYNHDNNTNSYSLTTTEAVTTSWSYSQTTAFSFGGSVSIEISAELFGIGTKDTATFNWDVTHEEATTTATSTATTVACAATGTLKPNEGVEVTGTYVTGKGSWAYDSSVVVHLKDGSNYSYSENGLLTNVAHTECSVTWKSINDPSIPNSPGYHVAATT